MKLRKNISAKLNRDEEYTVNILQALGDRTRFKMVKIMLSNKEMCVSEVAEALGVSVPAVSQHFKILELVGLVDKERFGQKICYNLKSDDQLVNQLIELTVINKRRVYV